jgi:hypothetical protein
VSDAHPHRFRDTFAVSMLENGETLQAVADALGNRLAITQKHYNPKSIARQQRLDEAVQRPWGNDPVPKKLDEMARLHAEPGPGTMRFLRFERFERGTWRVRGKRSRPQLDET